jgi:hypothetical protein
MRILREIRATLTFSAAAVRGLVRPHGPGGNGLIDRSFGLLIG